MVKKLAAYIILGINSDGHKEVLSITTGENEGAKYWLGELNSPENRGVKDIFITQHTPVHQLMYAVIFCHRTYV
ncbi:MAG: transposase [Oscillospiraceae bacterium]|nr:transposase [Oscillospiraceae bacterium]